MRNKKFCFLPVFVHLNSPAIVLLPDERYIIFSWQEDGSSANFTIVSANAVIEASESVKCKGNELNTLRPALLAVSVGYIKGLGWRAYLGDIDGGALNLKSRESLPLLTVAEARSLLSDEKWIEKTYRLELPKAEGGELVIHMASGLFKTRTYPA